MKKTPISNNFNVLTKEGTTHVDQIEVVEQNKGETEQIRKESTKEWVTNKFGENPILIEQAKENGDKKESTNKIESMEAKKRQTEAIKDLLIEIKTNHRVIEKEEV